VQGLRNRIKSNRAVKNCLEASKFRCESQINSKNADRLRRSQVSTLVLIIYQVFDDMFNKIGVSPVMNNSEAMI
jgi:hypothetical protein